MKIEWAYYTNRGKIRAENQDALFVGGFGVIGDMRRPICGMTEDAERAFYCVIDGAGGHASGEIASRTVAAEFVKSVPDLKAGQNRLTDVLNSIQDKMTAMANRDPELAGMAAALAGVLLEPGALSAFNVGDCRVYVLRWGYLKKLTHDHSLVQILRDNDIIGDDEMRTHPDKARITSALEAGSPKHPEVFVHEEAPENPETVLICSDGVWESLSAVEIEKALSRADRDFRAAADRLFDALSASECGDNVSFILLNLSAGSVPKGAPA
ncbi:MAG: serine/threonine-protein phosphatase [Synergistaceae bacterium]|jgi:protein phosphatase|nr:serine/threonine-protein phosphatase [Synergistaceae bacterium]